MTLKLLLLISLTFISGCALFQPDVVVETKLIYTKVVCPDYPKPAGVKMLEVKPRAVFDKNGIAWVGLTPRHYEHLGINLQELIRYTKSQKGQTSYYQNCILAYNAEIERLREAEKSR